MDVREHGARLRKAFEAAAAPRGRRYFAELLRREATAYFVARAAEGLGAETVGQEIGLAANTLRRWQKEFTPVAPSAPRAARAPRPAFVPPTAVAPPSPALVVRGPHGVRVEGLDLAALAELLRRLA